MSLVCAVVMAVPRAVSETGSVGKLALPVSAVLSLRQAWMESVSDMPLKVNFTLAILFCLVNGNGIKSSYHAPLSYVNPGVS